MRRCVTVLVGCVVAAWLSALPRAQVPAPPVPLNVLLSKAATYVERYAAHLSGLVMEEAYVQDVEQLNRFGYRQNTRGGVSHRQLRSDLLLVRPQGAPRPQRPARQIVPAALKVHRGTSGKDRSRKRPLQHWRHRADDQSSA